MSKKQKPTPKPRGQRPRIDLEAFDREAREYSEQFSDMETSVYLVQATLRLLQNIFEEYTTPTKGMTLDQVNEVLSVLNLSHDYLGIQAENMAMLERKFAQARVLLGLPTR